MFGTDRKIWVQPHPGHQGWHYGTVRSEFAYYVPRTLNRTVLTSRTRTITKKAYRTSVQ